MARVSDYVRQSAAIPIKSGQVCLVTSSNGKRWVLPKGIIEPGQTAGETALQEAWEEAGLTGIINPEPFGSYIYHKWCGTCHVIVFLMHVTNIASVWPENGLRQRCWLNPASVLNRIEETDLIRVLEAALSQSCRPLHLVKFG